MTAPKPRRAGWRPTADFALGATGCCLAAASAAFGVGMAVHGPVASFGTQKDFTVFAQFAPRDPKGMRKAIASSEPTARAPSAAADDLDMTATASIPSPGASLASAGEAAVIPQVVLEKASADAATVVVAGRSRVVRVGDTVPGAGEILAILPGRRPLLRTSRGLIVPAPGD